MKLCPKCQLEKPLDEFYGRDANRKCGWCKPCSRARSKAYYHANRETAIAARLEWARRNPEAVKAIKAKWAFGISREDFEALPKACEVCGSTDRLAVDHDHETGRIRGRLCRSCNVGIGMLGDDVERLQAALDYLQR